MDFAPGMDDELGAPHDSDYVMRYAKHNVVG